MNDAFARREFLGCAGATAAGAIIAGLGMSPIANGVEPIGRKGKPRFRFSVAAYGFLSYLTKPSANYTLFDFVDECAAMKSDAVELTSYYFPSDLDDAYLAKMKAHCFKAGLDISGTAIANDFCLAPGPEREKQLSHVRKWIDIAARLGAPVIRVFSGNAAQGQDRDEARRLAIEGFEQTSDYAGSRGVFLALENHGGISQHIPELVSLVKEVKSPWFGINLDTGNFQSSETPEQAYREMELMAPFALNVQIKVSLSTAKGKSQGDWERQAKILAGAGHQGYIVLEYEEQADPKKSVPVEFERLKSTFSAVLN